MKTTQQQIETALYRLAEATMLVCRERHFNQFNPAILECIDDAKATLQAALSPTPSVTRTLVIEVDGGVVKDLHNLPEDWEYDVLDHDDLGYADQVDGETLDDGEWGTFQDTARHPDQITEAEFQAALFNIGHTARRLTN